MSTFYQYGGEYLVSTPGPLWILETGDWNDDGVWDDNAVWID
jgi:hypothetical protein